MLRFFAAHTILPTLLLGTSTLEPVGIGSCDIGLSKNELYIASSSIRKYVLCSSEQVWKCDRLSWHQDSQNVSNNKNWKLCNLFELQVLDAATKDPWLLIVVNC